MSEANSTFKEGSHYYEARDLSRAVRCWEKAAAQGHLPALFSLGCLYGAHAERTGFKQDWAEAYFYLSIIHEIHVRAGNAVDDGGVIDDAAKHLTPEQKAAVDKRVAEWKPAVSSSAKE